MHLRQTRDMSDEWVEAAASPQAGETGDLAPIIHEPGPRLPQSVQGPIDVALGAAATVATPIVAVGRAAAYVAAPAAGAAWKLVKNPPLIPPALTLGSMLDRFGERGRNVRQSAAGDLTNATTDTLDAVVPGLVPGLVGQVVDRVDVTALVLDVVDVDRIVTKALDGMNLTDVVINRVDLDRIVTKALDGMDLTELVRTRVDVAALAEDVIDDVDLPAIIRDSTTGVAADVINQGRLVALSGDELVNRWVDKFLFRRNQRQVDVEGAAGRQESTP